MPSGEKQGTRKLQKKQNRSPNRRQYYGQSTPTEYNGYTYHTQGEARLAKIFTEQMDPPVAFTPYVHEECVDLDGKLTYEPDFFTERKVSFPGMGLGARYFEVKGFLSRDAVRNMRALENKTGHKGWILLPAHLRFIEREGTDWKDEDYANFEPPDFTRNCDKGALQDLRALLVNEGIPFEESAAFNCIGYRGEDGVREAFKFDYIGHFYFPDGPRKFFGIPNPVQVLRVVVELRKNEILAIEALNATNQVHGYLVVTSHVYTWKKEGLVKRGRHRPIRSIPGPVTGSQNGKNL